MFMAMTARNLVLMGVSLLCLLACAPQQRYIPPDPLPPPNMLNARGALALKTVWVIIRFKEAVAFDDAEFLKTLQEQTLTQLRYVSAVSANTHAYRLDLPVDQDPATAMQRLSAFPAIERVEMDGTVKAY
jgi:hypothetical protein